MFQLKEQGFSNINALDPSKEMLQQAREKQVYDQLFCDFLGVASAVIGDGMFMFTEVIPNTLYYYSMVNITVITA